MRLLLRIGLVALLIVAAGVGGWLYANRDAIERRRAVLRVADAPNFAQAQVELRWFELAPEVDEKRAELVGYWGTGQATFDTYLAQHLRDPDCGEALRKRFSEELAWRPELRPLWATVWRERTKQPPHEEAASVLEFLDTLAKAETPPRLTWRQVLDVQAVFELRGRGDLAVRLTPENCLDRFRQFKSLRE